MTDAERALWSAVYAATVGAAIAGPCAELYLRSPHLPARVGQEPAVESASRLARLYADRAVADLRATVSP